MAAKSDDRVLIAAAKLRVTTDRKQGLYTPQWVKDLAERRRPTAEAETDPDEGQIGRPSTTPGWLKQGGHTSTNGGKMGQHVIQAEIVRPLRPAAEQFGVFLAALFWLGFRVLIVWWALAAWFPELGITYWQAILPVYAIRCLVSSQTIIGRQLTK